MRRGRGSGAVRRRASAMMALRRRVERVEESTGHDDREERSDQTGVIADETV